MSAAAVRTRPRGRLGRSIVFVDDFMSWFLYGRETWLVALFKGVPMFFFIYFLMTYIPNYAFFLTTTEGLFLSDAVGYLVAMGVASGNFVAIILLVVLIQVARGRVGPGWTFLRIFVFLNYLFVVLLLIPLMAFGLAGGRLWPPLEFPLVGLAFGAVLAGLGAAALVYLYLEYQRITGQDAEEAEATSRAYAART
jgi:hypothetical protein